MTQKTIPDGAREIAGAFYMTDQKGSLVPVETIKAQDLLMDEMVRGLITKAKAIAEALANFKSASFAQMAAFNSLLAQQYNAGRGGKKGNVTFVTFDGLMKVSVAVADNIVFGPELQIAKTIIDECLVEWAAGGREELRTIVMRAFNVDKQGQINRSEMFGLLQLEFEDERWQRAMQAIRDSMRVSGTKEYVRFYSRPAPDAEWKPISLDIAAL